MTKVINIVSILDRSGSMGGSEDHVISSYNEFIASQIESFKGRDIEVKTTLVLFDDRVEEVYTGKSLLSTPKLTNDVYYVRGMTALYDAVGMTINKFKDEKNAIFFIETDGHENQSKEYSAGVLKSLVEERTAFGWDFNFVGADLNEMTTNSIGNAFGVTKTMAFSKTTGGYATRNTMFKDATMAYADKVQGN